MEQSKTRFLNLESEKSKAHRNRRCARGAVLLFGLAVMSAVYRPGFSLGTNHVEHNQNLVNTESDAIPRGLIAHYNFDGDRPDVDKIKGARLKIFGGARIAGGVLKLRGAGQYGLSDASLFAGRKLQSRTLVSWVRLTSLQRTAGSIIGLDSHYDKSLSAPPSTGFLYSHANFDSIVYAEYGSGNYFQPGSEHRRRWARGSDLKGPKQTKVGIWKMVTMTMDASNQYIAVYINGEQVMNYKTTPLPQYDGNRTRLIVGFRTYQHGFMNADIRDMKVYDRVLSLSEIFALSGSVMCLPAGPTVIGGRQSFDNYGRATIPSPGLLMSLTLNYVSEKMKFCNSKGTCVSGNYGISFGGSNNAYQVYVANSRRQVLFPRKDVDSVVFSRDGNYRFLSGVNKDSVNGLKMVINFGGLTEVRRDEILRFYTGRNLIAPNSAKKDSGSSCSTVQFTYAKGRCTFRMPGPVLPSPPGGGQCQCVSSSEIALSVGFQYTRLPHGVSTDWMIYPNGRDWEYELAFNKEIRCFPVCVPKANIPSVKRVASAMVRGRSVAECPRGWVVTGCGIQTHGGQCGSSAYQDKWVAPSSINSRQCECYYAAGASCQATCVPSTHIFSRTTVDAFAHGRIRAQCPANLRALGCGMTITPSTAGSRLHGNATYQFPEFYITHTKTACEGYNPFGMVIRAICGECLF